MSLTVNDMQQRVIAQTSMPSRLGYTLLLLAGAGMSGITGALVATEAALPTRTIAALATLSLIGLAWASFAGWVLARRRVLFAQHRIVASRLAVAVSTVVTLGAIALRDHVSSAAIGVAVVMLIAAVGSAWHAERYRARLIAQRDALRSHTR